MSESQPLNLPLYADIEDLDDDGRGMARVDGRVTFIEGALPGERVLFKVRKRRRQYDEAELTDVVLASPQRVSPRCKHVKMCGGCALQHLASDAQLTLKQKRLLNDLKIIGHSEPAAVLRPIQSEPWGYRHKCRFGARYVPKKGGVLVGFRERRGNRVADIETCSVLADEVGQHMMALRAVISALSVPDRIPQVEVALGEPDKSGRPHGALVVRHLYELTQADQDLLVGFASTRGFQIYVQPGGPDSVRLLWPEQAGLLSYGLPAFDLRIEFGPTDFTQVNPTVNRQMVAQAVDLLEVSASDRVLDLFCGVGNFSLALARRGASVRGVEGVAALVDRARANATLNGLNNATFEKADLNDAEQCQRVLSTPHEKILLDPARSGAKCVVENLLKPLPARIVYVSCNPATAARDCATLVNAHGYHLQAAGVIDMFPHTNHVESMTLFVRK